MTDPNTAESAGASPAGRIRVGISACLLGVPVRYDGGHSYDAFINECLSAYFHFVPVCPEAAIGLGVPRPSLRLVRAGAGAPRVRGARDPGLDVTEELRDYAGRIATGFDDVCGFILKKNSPSCGMERVKVYAESGIPVGRDAGVFARTLSASRPLLPMEEEGRLKDPVLRENFIARVFVYHRWQHLSRDLSPAGLVAFHSEHKYLIMAHSTEAYRRLGRLAARAGSEPIDALGREYVCGLMQALQKPVEPGRHVNVLQHLAGYLRRCLDAGDRAELAETIEHYRQGMIPLIVPIRLLQHHFRRHPDPYIQRQWYLEPHPYALGLRNRL